ncbi:MAG TPA: VWA domain-containing protein [Vicinamibacteria bacterium]|nr:VWA domain-containing protein [Vicinamibacteria bacterium]
MIRSRSLGGWVTGVILLTLLSTPAASAPPRFAVELDLVTVNVAVTNPRTRAFENGLGQEAFVVLEDGIPQQLVMFEQERLPIEVTLLIDNSNSMHPRLPAVKAAARRLIAALRPQDRARVVQFNHRMEILQDFTASHDKLGAAVDSVKVAGATGLYNALYLSLKDLRARRSAAEPCRHAIVVLSDGADTASLVTDDQVLQQARKSDVSVYAIGLGATRHAADASDTKAAYFLTALTRDTGGEAFFPRTLAELDGVYGRIADELRTQYTLGYVSSNPRRDGAWRSVAVQTVGGAALVRHRTGYYAPRDRGGSPVLAAGGGGGGR